MDENKQKAILRVRALMLKLGVTSGEVLFSEAEDIFPDGLGDLPELSEIDDIELK